MLEAFALVFGEDAPRLALAPVAVDISVPASSALPAVTDEVDSSRQLTADEVLARCRCADCRAYASLWRAENPGTSSGSGDPYPAGGMFYHGTVSGEAGPGSLPAASFDGLYASSSSDAMSYNSSDVEGMMAAGRRAYRREMQAQHLQDKEIELSLCQHMDNESVDIEAFGMLVEQDELQQSLEREEEDLYYTLLMAQDIEDREQLLFEQEVFPGLVLAEATWHRPGQERTAASGSNGREAASEPSADISHGASGSAARNASSPHARQ